MTPHPLTEGCNLVSTVWQVGEKQLYSGETWKGIR